MSKGKPVDPKTSEAALRFWYEHELTRLRASERAGFKVQKERALYELELVKLNGHTPETS